MKENIFHKVDTVIRSKEHLFLLSSGPIGNLFLTVHNERKPQICEFYHFVQSYKGQLSLFYIYRFISLINFIF
jgi:hypothetical protein